MKRVTACIDNIHSYDECELQLSNTMYFLFKSGRRNYTTVDFELSVEDNIIYKVVEDLFFLGLLVESIDILRIQ